MVIIVDRLKYLFNNAVMGNKPFDITLPPTEAELGQVILKSSPTYANVVRRLAFDRDRQHAMIVRALQQLHNNSKVVDLAEPSDVATFLGIGEPLAATLYASAGLSRSQA